MGNANAAKYRQRIAIQQPIDTPNTSGGAARTWTTVAGCASVPANITYPPPSKKGDEAYNDGQVHSSVFATMTIRYMPSLNINAAMQILYGTRVFNVRTVLIQDEYPDEITLQCEEIQASGDMH